MKSEILLLVNSFLLTIITLAFAVIVYFLKSLHADFKSVVERVNHLYTELNTHLRLHDNFSGMFQKQLDGHDERISHLENEKKS